ncbi:hypothetical protein Hamer_G010120 [Homarus americanus]|uniref:Uncharacterized protein n=1 Tax=Homarus americanus TaxID=6706 RepID=A0A8J5MYG2_HOMAM|nr:hypothetical protein Hamer_G010120 [Homarus americanus]
MKLSREMPYSVPAVGHYGLLERKKERKKGLTLVHMCLVLHMPLNVFTEPLVEPQFNHHLKSFEESQKVVQTSPINLYSIYRTSPINLCSIYRTSPINLYRIYRTSPNNLSSIYRTSPINLYSIYRTSPNNLYSIYRTSSINLYSIYRTSPNNLYSIYRTSPINLSSIYRVSSDDLPASINRLVLSQHRLKMKPLLLPIEQYEPKT